MQLTRILSGIVILVPGVGGAVAADPELRSVSMEDCVQQAIEHNLDIRIQRINPELARYTLGSSYGYYDPSLSFSSTENFSASAGGIDAQGRQYPPTTIDGHSINAGLGGNLPYGGNLQINHFIGETERNHASSIFDSQGSVGVSMTQPLLRNFWFDQPRLLIKINKSVVKQRELGLRGQIMQTVSDVHTAYYNLIAARENVKVQQTALDLAEQLYKENKKRVEVGVLAPLDEKQAQSQVAASKAALLVAQGSATSAENTLKSLITDKYSELQNVSLQPSEPLNAVAQTFSRQDSWQKGLTMRPELLTQKLTLDQNKITVRYNYNQLFPELDLRGSYQLAGVGEEFPDALNGIVVGNSPGWSFTASVTVPLSNRSARYNYKGAKATVQQSLLTLKKIEEGIMVQIDNDINQAQTSLERVEATRQARLYAEAALDAEQKKLDSGKSMSFLVLQAQRDLTQRKSDEIGALTDYNNALVQLALHEGSTLDLYHIKVETK